MEVLQLTYGDVGFKEIQQFLKQTNKENYTLSIYDMLTQTTAEIECSINDMLPVIIRVVSIEKDFPQWIGVNDLSKSYVVGMNLTRGHILTPGLYEYVNEEIKPSKKD